MADTTADEKDQHAALKDTLKIMGAHQWHETTCKRGKDVKGACVFGRARNMRNELEAKIKLTNAGGFVGFPPQVCQMLSKVLTRGGRPTSALLRGCAQIDRGVHRSFSVHTPGSSPGVCTDLLFSPDPSTPR